LDQPDFDVVAHINNLFPTEQSLASLNDVMQTVEHEIIFIDQEIRDFVRHQTGKGGEDGVTALARAQASIEALVAKVMDMKGRAEQSEAAVRDMTRDIRQLDTAKRNLTAAITTLNHLNMLVAGVETLQYDFYGILMHENNSDIFTLCILRCFLLFFDFHKFVIFRTLVKTRQYGDVANLLQGVGNVVEHFENYQSIPQISQLSQNVRKNISSM